jgi:O-antigen/teichoic acid export membrane protein
VRVLAVFLPLSTAATVLTSATRGFGTMVPTVTLENLGRQGIRPVAVFAVLSAGLGTTAVAVAYGLPVLLPLVAGGIWLVRLLHRAERQDDIEEGPHRPTGELAGEFWRFTAPRGLAAFFNVTLFRVDTLLLGALLTASAAGIYTAATRLTITGFLALTAVQQVIAPQISELLTVRETLDRAKLVYQTATQWLVILSWPVYFTLAVFAPLLLQIYRADYTAGAPALSVLSIATLAIMATGPCSVVLVMGGKSVWALVNSGVALVVDIALNFALIPKFGITGAAIAWGVAILVNNLIAVYQVRRFLGLSPVGDGFWLAAGSSTLCFGALGLLVRLTIGTTLFGFLLFAVVGGGLYLGFLWLHRDRLHLTILRQALTSRKRRMAERAEWRRAAGSALRPSGEGLVGGSNGGGANGAADLPAAPQPAALPTDSPDPAASGDDWPLGLEEPELEGLPTWMPLASAAELTGLDEADLRARIDAGDLEGDMWWGPARQDVLMIRTVDLFRQGLVRASPDPASEIAPGLPPDTLG